MSINKHISIYKKYVQARDAFGSETLKLLTNLSGGHKTKKKIAMYNTIAAWLDFIGQEVPEPISVQATSPAPVTFKVIRKSLPSDTFDTNLVSLFIKDSEGIRTKLFSTAILTYVGLTLNQAIGFGLQNLIDIGTISIPGISVNINYANDNITLNFPQGSKYNAGEVVVSDNAYTEPALVRILGGSDQIFSTPNLSEQEMERVDDLLDRIAIELGLIYSDKKYEDITSRDIVRGNISQLRTPKNLSLTAEDGSPLEV
tara:strand:+ start:1105 stop:1875 length:771 start_codon:yes stop_codon:yes gene_type:complete